ncbi:MAG: cobalamin B12-binding domain-containing protein [Candidatus Geothermincolia bacterium]
MDIGEKLIAAVAELKEQESLDLAGRMLDTGVEPTQIIEVSRRGMEIVGERYERREYYLSALIMSGEIFKNIVRLLERSFCMPEPPAEPGNQIILGAPLGDVHDIGMGVVSILLRCSGFKVVELGVNVTPAKFLEAAKRTGAPVIGMSALLTVAYEPIRETIASFEKEGLRENVRIMLGGGAISERVCEYAGADAWGRDAMDAVRFAKIFTGKETG